MSNFRTIDRKRGFLLPPSVDEGQPEKHLARFVVEVMDGLDLRAMSGVYRGSGSEPNHPRMLLGILVYGYAAGVFLAGSLSGPRMTQWRSALLRPTIIPATTR
jgi:transposase